MNKFFVLCCACFMLSACGVEQVDTGHRGVKSVFGKVESESLPEGLYFYNLFTSSILEIDTRVITNSWESEAYTKDMQVAKVKLTVSTSLVQDKVPELYTKIGPGYIDSVVTPRVVGALKNVFGTLEADKIVANRESVSRSIAEGLRKDLADSFINVNTVVISDIEYSAEFDRANEQKQVAVQQAVSAKNRTVQIEEEGRQRIITAKAEAEAMQIKTEALSKSQSLVAYEAVQKWNGILPTYVGGDAPVPFLSVK